MRRLILFSVITALFAAAPKALAVTDYVTLEALISLHKMTNTKELAIREKLTWLNAGQIVTKRETSGFKEKMDIYHQRLQDAQGWVQLASTLANLGMKIYNTEKDVEEFLAASSEFTKKGAMPAAIYASGLYKIQKDVRKAIKDLATLEISNLNILRSSMKQKLQLVYFIDSTISNIRHTMEYTLFYCRWCTGKEFFRDNLRHLFSSEMSKDAAGRAIDAWKNR